MVHAMDAEIGLMPRRFSGRAVGVLSRAFDQDPILAHYLGHGPRRALADGMFFGDILQSALPFGHVYAAIGQKRLLGVAVWRPPDASTASFSVRANSALRAAGVRALYPRASRELFGGFATIEQLHPSEPHWYLMFVGIDPGLQGQGIGSRLLAPVLERADATRTLSYLETPFPRTHVLYQRLGFEIASESHPFRGAPPLWTMIRKPPAGPS
jgi:GNAT superfamily N-acetyltransferase